MTVPAGGESDIGDRFFREPGTLHVWAEGTVALDQPTAAPNRSRCPTPTSLPLAPCGRCWPRRASRSPAPPARPPTRCSIARPAAHPPLAEVTSRPFRDWVFPILNTSQNWFAEMLLKQLGRQFGRAGSWDEGLAVERRFLIDSVRVDSTEFSTAGRLGPLEREPGESARLHADPALHPVASRGRRPSSPGCRSRAAWARSGAGSSGRRSRGGCAPRTEASAG